MSEHLSDDPDHWPTNPYELFGVSPGTDAKELRRVYTRLIRRFKPEQNPEAFRRIREAYDQLQRWSAYVVPCDDDSAPTVAEELPPPRSDADDPDRPWRRAMAGEMAEAYRALGELHERRPECDEAAIRLYWLLRVDPSLDPRRTPLSWLVRSLAATGFVGRARELFRRDAHDRPECALGNEVATLWTAPGPVDRLAELVEWRWAAAGRMQAWSLILADRDALRQRIVRDSEEAWLRLLMAAADQLAWTPPHESDGGWTEVLDEIGRFEHLASRMAWAFDRLDFLRELAAGWCGLADDRTGPTPLLQLLRDSWTRSPDEIRADLVAFLEKVAHQPSEWLKRFDRVHQRSPALLGQYGAILEQGRFPEPVAVDPGAREMRRQLVLDLIWPAGWDDYQRLRETLLTRAIREAIPPGWIAEVAEEYGAMCGNGTTPSRLVAGNAPLRMVYESWRRFWA